jgi:hypothetical protein
VRHDARVPSDSFAIHALFDVLAWIAAAGSGFLLVRSGRIAFAVEPAKRTSYYAALVGGAALGAYGFGSLNMVLSGEPAVARSIEGAIFGGILAIEIYKRRAGIDARTGARFALPLAAGVAIGRIGCFLAGLPDFTYGTPTALPWAHDFGDGVPRHPVQLYESFAMALFAGAYLLALARNSRFAVRNGFYLCVGYYGAQRFLWEFFKPYGALIGPFSIFHLLSAALVVYAAAMLARPKRDAADERAALPAAGP